MTTAARCAHPSGCTNVVHARSLCRRHNRLAMGQHCLTPGCPNAVYGRGLCRTCYRYRGKVPTTLARPERPKEGVCTVCGVTFPFKSGSQRGRATCGDRCYKRNARARGLTGEQRHEKFRPEAAAELDSYLAQKVRAEVLMPWEKHPVEWDNVVVVNRGEAS
jgi:hypothetical protein